MILLHNFFHGTTYTLRCSPAKLQTLLLLEGEGKRQRALDRARRALCPYGPLDCRCGDNLNARSGDLSRSEYAYQTRAGRQHLDAEAATELQLEGGRHA